MIYICLVILPAACLIIKGFPPSCNYQLQGVTSPLATDMLMTAWSTMTLILTLKSQIIKHQHENIVACMYQFIRLLKLILQTG